MPGLKKEGSGGTWADAILPSCSKSKILLVFIAVCGSILLAVGFFRLVVLHAQQNCLRNVVTDMSTILNERGLDHWWDFGTLLGIVRGNDIIFTEVDADISLPVSTRESLFKDDKFESMMARRGYSFEKRDEYKLRVYGPWGWFADVDVWVPRKYPNGTETLFMITGKHVDKRRYELPKVWLVPTTTREAEGMLDDSAVPTTLRLPAAPKTVLAYWYGSTWTQPRRYDKGNDPSTDTFELFVWKYCMWVYELAMLFKYLIRIESSALRALSHFVLNTVNAAGLLFCVAIAGLVCGNPQRRTPLHVVLVVVLAVVGAPVFMVTLLAMGF